jgi:hypothetical protein
MAYTSTICVSVVICLLQLHASLAFPANHVTIQENANNGSPDSPHPYGGGSSVQNQGLNEDCINTEPEVGELITLSKSKLTSMYNSLSTVTSDIWNMSFEQFFNSVNGINLTTEISKSSFLPSLVNCQKTQRMLSKSITLLRCYSDHLGFILTNVTQAVVYTNTSSAMKLFRENIYKAYENVTVINEFENLVATFPVCTQMEAETFSNNVTCPSDSNHIIGTLPVCSSDAPCHHISDDHLKMIATTVVIANGIDQYIKINSNKPTMLSFYRDYCLAGKSKY